MTIGEGKEEDKLRAATVYVYLLFDGNFFALLVNFNFK